MSQVKSVACGSISVSRDRQKSAKNGRSCSAVYLSYLRGGTVPGHEMSSTRHVADFGDFGSWPARSRRSSGSHASSLAQFDEISVLHGSQGPGHPFGWQPFQGRQCHYWPNTLRLLPRLSHQPSGRRFSDVRSTSALRRMLDSVIGTLVWYENHPHAHLRTEQEFLT